MLRWIRSPLDFCPRFHAWERNSQNAFLLLPPNFQARASPDPTSLGDLKELYALTLNVSLHLLGPPNLVRAISLGVCPSEQCPQGTFQNSYYSYRNPYIIAGYLAHLMPKTLNSVQFYLLSQFKFKVSKFKF